MMSDIRGHTLRPIFVYLPLLLSFLIYLSLFFSVPSARTNVASNIHSTLPSYEHCPNEDVASTETVYSEPDYTVYKSGFSYRPIEVNERVRWNQVFAFFIFNCLKNKTVTSS